MIISFRRVGEIYMYWYMELPPTYMVNCKKREVQNNWQISSSCSSWPTLHSPFCPWPLKTHFYGTYHWAPKSSGCWMPLASEEPQHGPEERKVRLSVPSLPASCFTALSDFFLPSSGSHSLSPQLSPCGASIAWPCIWWSVKKLSSHFPNLSVPSVS